MRAHRGRGRGRGHGQGGRAGPLRSRRAEEVEEEEEPLFAVIPAMEWVHERAETHRKAMELL